MRLACLACGRSAVSHRRVYAGRLCTSCNDRDRGLAGCDSGCARVCMCVCMYAYYVRRPAWLLPTAQATLLACLPPPQSEHGPAPPDKLCAAWCWRAGLVPWPWPLDRPWTSVWPGRPRRIFVSQGLAKVSSILPGRWRTGYSCAFFMYEYKLIYIKASLCPGRIPSACTACLLPRRPLTCIRPA